MKTPKIPVKVNVAFAQAQPAEHVGKRLENYLMSTSVYVFGAGRRAVNRRLFIACQKRNASVAPVFPAIKRKNTAQGGQSVRDVRLK